MVNHWRKSWIGGPMGALVTKQFCLACDLFGRAIRHAENLCESMREDLIEHPPALLQIMKPAKDCGTREAVMYVKLDASKRTDEPVRDKGPHIIDDWLEATRGGIGMFDFGLPHRQHHCPSTGEINSKRLVAENMGA